MAEEEKVEENESKATEDGEGGDQKEGGGKKKGKKAKGDGDMLSESSLDNVYYGCHNVQELLQARGYVPPGFEGKKKKGKK